MPDREKVIKTLTDALTAKENYPWARAEMSFEFIETLLDLLKEQEEQKRRWLQSIANNQLANAPTDTMDLAKFTYYAGIHQGLQMAWEILTEGRERDA